MDPLLHDIQSRQPLVYCLQTWKYVQVPMSYKSRWYRWLWKEQFTLLLQRIKPGLMVTITER
jgi:hypothetical protein